MLNPNQRRHPLLFAGLLTGLTGTWAAIGLAQEPPPFRPDPEQVFRRADADRDGKLSLAEFERLARFGPRLRGNPQEAGTAFKRLDRNSDGALSLDEFRLGRPGAGPGRPPAEPAVEPATSERPSSPQELEFFEKKIRPVLIKHCYSCHSAESKTGSGGLFVDSREGLRRGGDKGPSFVPGKPDASLLIRAIRHTDSALKMPPLKEGGKLPAEVIADFERWVQMGAPDPRTGGASTAKKGWDLEKAREHWAFQPVKKPAVPVVKETAWPRSDVDRFILSELERKGLKHSGDADRRTLLRRVYFDLIGLPPAPKEVSEFVADTAPDALARVVDRLLASPRFGERWGRHWLDVARYAESSGKEVNFVYPHAWRYRDYVIQSLNADKPYDRFLREQLAGDLLPAESDRAKAEQIVATGYLAIGPKSHNTRDPRQFAADLADEQIDAVTQGMLGLTVACARCHDHKFDPIPQRDYYALAGIFQSTDTRYGTPRVLQNNQSTQLISLPSGADLPAGPSLRPAQLDLLRRQLEQEIRQRDAVLEEAQRTGQRPMQGDPRLLRAAIVIGTLEEQLERYDENGRPRLLAMGVREKFFPADARLLQRGEPDKPMDTVPRGFVQVLASQSQPSIERGSGRVELANWITSPSNPLTARVIVNRVWQHLYGRGLVASPDNFGTTGQKPSHAALLDHLAASFVADGWSLKRLIRSLVLTRTYQQSSDHDAAAHAVDPDNIYLWRMSKRRLEAEAIRDAMLAASGTLELTPPPGSPVANAEGQVLQLMRGGSFQQEGPYRSVYLPVLRDQAPESLEVFDFAEASLVVGTREDTTVPSQALYLLNSPVVRRRTEAMADRLVREATTGPDRVHLAFELTFSRPPRAGELSAANTFFEQFTRAEEERLRTRSGSERARLAAFCQALMGSAEFRYLD